MANPVNGRVTLTVDVAAGAETGWKAAQKEIQSKVKEALEAVEIKNVTIDAANLDFTTSLPVIEATGTEPEASGDEENPDSDTKTEDSTDAEEAPKEKKAKKKDKGSKAKAGKKKGRQ